MKNSKGSDDGDETCICRRYNLPTILRRRDSSSRCRKPHLGELWAAIVRENIRDKEGCLGLLPQRRAPVKASKSFSCSRSQPKGFESSQCLGRTSKWRLSRRVRNRSRGSCDEGRKITICTRNREGESRLAPTNQDQASSNMNTNVNFLMKG